ncbi:Alpha-amylase A type-3, partial [Colletotrichum tanaceti]
YQGQEQHFKGNSTPFNREPLWESEYDTSAPIYTLTSTLLKTRNQLQSLNNDFATTASEQLFVENTHLCLRKGPEGAQIVFCVTNKGSQGDSYELSVGGFNPGDEVVEVLSCATSTADGTGNVTLFMSKGEPKAVVPLAALDGTEICVNGTKQASADSGAGALGSSVTLILASVMAVSFALFA